MPESFKSKVTKWGFNFFPAYFFSGARIIYISHDFREVKIRLPLTWRTRNYVGSIYGGSMYSAVDPIYMIMLIKILGRDYIVWDKAAQVEFKKPGKSPLYAHFVVSEEELNEIWRLTKEAYSTDRIYPVELKDGKGETIAMIRKTLYIRRKDAVKPSQPA